MPSIIDQVARKPGSNQLSESCSDQACGHLARYRYSTKVDLWLCLDCDPPIEHRIKELQIWTVTPSPGWVTLDTYKAKNERLRAENENLAAYWDSLDDPMPLEAQKAFEEWNQQVWQKAAELEAKKTKRKSKQRRLG
ncbi:MAG: hypothetical protein ACPGLY_27195 [Rubripirellula sp.]